MAVSIAYLYILALFVRVTPLIKAAPLRDPFDNILTTTTFSPPSIPAPTEDAALVTSSSTLRFTSPSAIALAVSFIPLPPNSKATPPATRQFETFTDPHGGVSYKIYGSDSKAAGLTHPILGEWTVVIGWILVIYCFLSTFVMVWLWSMGWLDWKLSPTSHMPGLRTSYPHRVRQAQASRFSNTLPGPFNNTEQMRQAVLDAELRRLGMI